MGDGLVLLNSTGREVVAYATVEIDPTVSQPPPPTPAEPSVEFVTITASASTIDSIVMHLELWFHPQPRGPRDDVLVIKEPAFSIFDEMTGNPVAINQLTQDPLYANVWDVSRRSAQEPAAAPRLSATGVPNQGDHRGRSG